MQALQITIASISEYALYIHMLHIHLPYITFIFVQTLNLKYFWQLISSLIFFLTSYVFVQGSLALTRRGEKNKMYVVASILIAVF